MSVVTVYNRGWMNFVTINGKSDGESDDWTQLYDAPFPWNPEPFSDNL